MWVILQDANAILEALVLRVLVVSVGALHRGAKQRRSHLEGHPSAGARFVKQIEQSLAEQAPVQSIGWRVLQLEVRGKQHIVAPVRSKVPRVQQMLEHAPICDLCSHAGLGVLTKETHSLRNWVRAGRT
jgi:hypothetical protein